jgi:hypothetical protein
MKCATTEIQSYGKFRQVENSNKQQKCPGTKK